jgi:tRNA A-37 threonylcarbamoyl transferase component Bud32
MSFDTQSENYLKQNVSLYEFKMTKLVYVISKKSNNIINVPNVYKYSRSTMELQRIPNMCISDYYGELWENVPNQIKLKIIQIIQFLFSNNIIYPDITGYNFIEFDNKLWIIDFAHAFIFNNIVDLTYDKYQYYKFVKKFIKTNIKDNNWNMEFS